MNTKTVSNYIMYAVIVAVSVVIGDGIGRYYSAKYFDNTMKQLQGELPKQISDTLTLSDVYVSPDDMLIHMVYNMKSTRVTEDLISFFMVAASKICSKRIPPKYNAIHVVVTVNDNDTTSMMFDNEVCKAAGYK